MQTAKSTRVERKNTVTFKGNPLTLIGDEIRPGMKAPNFEALTNDLAAVTLGTYSGKTRVVSVVPSLDTPVCDAQTRRFNQEATKMSKDTVVLTISMDLPFAQKRWCGAAGVSNVITLSDHMKASFGTAYGTLIAELRLLTRSIFIIDKDDVVRYVEYVSEMTQEPDYAKALEELKKIA